ncbi:MAG: ATP binding [Vezdaea aestivalis]|nr:MAG: ATP binding [Vezdaea aestivalis]
MIASPTESEFSDAYDSADLIRSWDERSVAQWLKSINCGQYEPIFKANHFNGENLLECDQAVLKELGIKKIGDRVRIFVGIKNLRTEAYGKRRRRVRDSLPVLENPSYTPPSSGSPRPHATAARDRTPALSSSRRISRSFDSHKLGSAASFVTASSRPDSPHIENGHRLQAISQRHPGMSPAETASEYGSGYFSNPGSASTSTGRAPSDTLTARSRPGINSERPSVGPLPVKQSVIWVIHSDGDLRIVRGFNPHSAQDIIRVSLRKLSLREDHVKSYCFWILNGLEPDPAQCRKVDDAELVRICTNPQRPERHRLIIRKIHAGEPSDGEVQRAAHIALEERDLAEKQNFVNKNPRSIEKIKKLTGEPFAAAQPGRSPQPAGDDASSVHVIPRQGSQLRQLPSFLGQRPPSEMISSDLTTYFPDHQKEDIEKTVRMSMRRSARLSRATSRLSTASNFSFSSSNEDVPPIPNIADSWLRSDAPSSQRRLRPLSITRIGGGSSFRDSVASYMPPLEEESPGGKRESYIPFDSGSENNLPMHETSEEPSAPGSYYDATTSSTPDNDAGDSLNASLTQVLAEDGEGKDEELTNFLANGDSWEHIKYMKGALIGQGSFGSVYLALHSITGELMAVKQVEVPSKSGNPTDAKKRTMVDALRREIGLLRSFQHPNIVRYLGSSSDDDYLNIFLEYVPGGSVAQMLNSYGPLHEPLIRNFVRQILHGLNYLHEREIIHRDIKGANVLVDNKGCVKISDFGISKRVEATSALNKGAGNVNRPSLQGSVFWMAPEVVKQTSYTLKADIWSLGCLVIEMFTGDHPYPNSSQLQAIFKIGNSKESPTLPEKASEDAVAFLSKTFEIDHMNRPDASWLLQSPFCQQTA